jgi:hypothetical protein
MELLQRLRSEPIRLLDLLSTDPIRRRRASKRLGARRPFRAVTRFLDTYIVRRGFLDGECSILKVQIPNFDGRDFFHPTSREIHQFSQ